MAGSIVLASAFAISCGSGSVPSATMLRDPTDPMAASPSAPVASASSLPTPKPTVRPTPTPPPTRPPTPAPTPWVPDGFTELNVEQFGFGDFPVVAYRWLGPGEYECEYSGSRCWGLLMIPRDGCGSGLQVAVSIEDRAGVVIDFGLDSVGSVDEGQQARLIFHSFLADSYRVEVSDIDCF